MKWFPYPTCRKACDDNITCAVSLCRARKRPLKAASWTGDQSDSTSGWCRHKKKTLTTQSDMVKLSEWDSKCIPAAVSALTLPAATHHSSKGSRKKQQSHSDMSSLVESLCVQQTYFTVAILKAALFLFLFFFSMEVEVDVGSSSVFSVFVAQLLVLWCHFLSQQAVFALQEAGWLNVVVGSRPMKVQGAPVEQVCNLCVIWHCTSTPILCSRRWAALRMGKKWHYM